MEKNYVKKSFSARRRTRKAIALSCLAVFMALTIGLTWTFWSGDMFNPADRTPWGGVEVGTGVTVNTEIRLGSPANAYNNAFSFVTAGADTRLAPQGIFGSNEMAAEVEGHVNHAIALIPVTWTADPESLNLMFGGLSATLTVNVGDEIRLADATADLLDPPLMNTDSGFANRDLTYGRRHENRYYTDASNRTGVFSDLFEFEFRVYVGTVAPTLVTATTGTSLVRDPATGAVETDIYAGTQLWIIVIVRMNFPATEEIYNQIADEEVAFQFTFSVDHPHAENLP